jgi:hypothetical protein
MRAVILLFFIIKDYLSHAQVDKIKNSQWALAGLPSMRSAYTVNSNVAIRAFTSRIITVMRIVLKTVNKTKEVSQSFSDA